ncbi:transcriptional regulator [Pseudoroseomonas deserti]|uniref:Transcriptional regulator n=1 Tax=Teichococcus deserti TaxID=1817963 RepID=A0A1V2H1Q2_9PROT|nr:LysR family transcriptional regulator [Pseudoroseomonas deserti]ONG53246.1 transcriptional regulator [Pseudoroseomonas deserti]
MDRGDIPSLDDLRAFQTVARLGSVRAAAEALSLTHGAVSRRVAKLSAVLGLRLLQPAGRGIRLTPEGEILAGASTQAFALIGDALRTLKEQPEQGPILLSCERSLAMRWLIPRLSDFLDRHPGIEVHLATGGGLPDFSRSGAALAIRRLDFSLDPAWQILPLMPERVGPVMLPAMQPRFEAGAYAALGARTRPEAWTAWLEAHSAAPRPAARQVFDHHFLMVEAALGGLGVALAPEAMVADELRAGRLVAPRGFAPDGTRYGLIRPRRDRPQTEMSPALALLCGWLQEIAALSFPPALTQVAGDKDAGGPA